MNKKKLKVKTGKKEKHGDVVEKLEGKLVRALADYDNLHKRFDREKDKFLQFANKGLIARFLTIYDMLESAQEHINDSGIAIILEEFTKILQEEKVEKIAAKAGSKFDEKLMEAVEAESGKKGDEGKVAEVFLTGWKFVDGPIVRPVKVKVYKRDK